MLGILVPGSTRSGTLETCSEGLAVARHTDYPMIRPPGARDQLESESEIEKKLIEQAIKSGEAVTKPLKNWWED